MSHHVIKTPCVGLCSTAYGDSVCRGCKRFDFEVIHWNGYTEDEKQAIWLRLGQLLHQVMVAKLQVFNADRLHRQLVTRQIRFVQSQSEYCWAYHLISRGARMINDLNAYGIVLLPEFRDWALTDLRDAIDSEFLLLSEAYYQRYIGPRFLKESLAG